MKHTVFIYAIVVVKVPNIEAESQLEAMKKADLIDLNFLSDTDHPKDVEYVEYADDIDGFLVDEDNDPGFEKSTWYDKHYNPLQLTLP